MSDKPDDWLREPEQGWIEIERQDDILRNSFVSRSGSPLAVRYFRSQERTVRAKAIFGPGTEGPPGCAHGGSMAALLDEVMGCAIWSGGYLAVSADLHVHFRKVLPIPQRCIAEARIVRVDGRKIWASGRLCDVARATVFAEAEGIFLESTARFVEKV
jgi:acyl-coenzyme A thioesterase PaaI-like protein